MSKIQVFQLIAIVVLAVYVLVMYQSDQSTNWLFYLIVAINLVLWIFRQIERKKRKETKS